MQRVSRPCGPVDVLELKWTPADPAARAARPPCSSPRCLPWSPPVAAGTPNPARPVRRDAGAASASRWRCWAGTSSVANLRFVADHVLIDVDAARGGSVGAAGQTRRPPVRSLRRAGPSDRGHRARQLRVRCWEPTSGAVVGRRRRIGSPAPSASGRSGIRLRCAACTPTPRATASPAPPSPTRRRSRSGCRRPTSTTPVWW